MKDDVIYGLSGSTFPAVAQGMSGALQFGDYLGSTAISGGALATLNVHTDPYRFSTETGLNLLGSTAISAGALATLNVNTDPYRFSTETGLNLLGSTAISASTLAALNAHTDPYRFSTETGLTLLGSTAISAGALAALNAHTDPYRFSSASGLNLLGNSAISAATLATLTAHTEHYRFSTAPGLNLLGSTAISAGALATLNAHTDPYRFSTASGLSSLHGFLLSPAERSGLLAVTQLGLGNPALISTGTPSVLEALGSSIGRFGAMSDASPSYTKSTTLFGGEVFASTESPTGIAPANSSATPVAPSRPRAHPNLTQTVADLSDPNLAACLASLAHDLVPMYQGAWAAAALGGPDAVRQACVSARELLKNVLNGLSPQEDAIQWYRRPGSVVDRVFFDRRKPTWVGRVNFLFASRGREAEFLMLVTSEDAGSNEWIDALFSDVSDEVHSRTPILDVPSLRGHLKKIERVLWAMLKCADYD